MSDKPFLNRYFAADFVCCGDIKKLGHGKFAKFVFYMIFTLILHLFYMGRGWG